MAHKDVSQLSQHVEEAVEAGDDRQEAIMAEMQGDPPLAKAIFQDAKEATETEHATTPLEGFRMYPKAVAWSCLVTMAVVMDAYDENLLKSLFAQRAFKQAFGERAGKGYQVSAPWQAGTSNAATIGIMIGMCVNGWVRDRMGMKKTMLTACVVLTGFVFILVFAQSLPMLLVGELLCGCCWGIFHATAPIYASEVCPTVLRGYLTTFVNMSAV